MIRNENVSVLINATPIIPTSVNLTLSIGKGYNTSVIEGLDLVAEVSDSVAITMNTIVYNLIVDKKEYGKNTKVTLLCVGEPATLEDDVVSDTEYTYTNSNELIESSRGSISVVNNIPNIEFTGQTYSKTSTAMSRILDMVRVIGGEAWETNGTLNLNPIKTISATPTIAHTFADGEVMDFAYSDKRDKSTKLKQVLFNPITDDLYSENSITLDFDEELSRGEVFFNPSLSAGNDYTIEGIDAREATTTVKTETIAITEVSSIITLGGIDSIVYITLNGEPIDVLDYVLYAGYNIVRFTSQLTGEIIISYSTKSVVVYAYKNSIFLIKHLCSICDGTIEIDADNVVDSGLCYAKIDPPLTYENGGTLLVSSGVDYTVIFVEEKGATNLVQHSTKLLVGGGTLTIKYLYTTTDWVDKDFMSNFTSALISTIESTSGEIIYDEALALYVLYLDKPVASINDVYFGSSILSGYSYVAGTVPYISFLASDVGKTVDVSMTIDLIDVSIPAPLVGHPVTLFDVITCVGVATERFMLDDNMLCSIPATFKLDVASLFGLEIHEVFGSTLTGDLGTLIVDNLGMVEVTVTTATLHTIDCSSIKDNGQITVDANGVV